MMSEIEVRQRARRFIADANAGEIPALPTYAKLANARIRSESLERGESANTVQLPNGGFVITVNHDESEERKRFSICHEIAHIVLGLPTVHGDKPIWTAVKRHPNEVMCDWFASEILMPFNAFEKRIPSGDPSVAMIEDLRKVFGSSFPATASRYASLAAFPCAYVMMDGATVTYASANAALRQKGIRVVCKCPIPHGSVAQRLRTDGHRATDTEQIAQDVWLENCEAGYDLWELSRHNSEYDETISLLWCAEEDLPRGEVDRFNKRIDEDDGSLEELTGVISWEKHGPRRK